MPNGLDHTCHVCKKATHEGVLEDEKWTCKDCQGKKHTKHEAEHHGPTSHVAGGSEKHNDKEGHNSRQHTNQR
jgi:hypothetical protein